MFNKGKISSAQQAKKEALEEVGYVFEKVSKSGWIWSTLTDQSDGKLATESEVVDDAWRDASEQAQRILSIPDETWNRMGVPEQREMIADALSSGD